MSRTIKTLVRWYVAGLNPSRMRSIWAEATRRVPDYALNDLGVGHLIAETQSANEASRRLSERLLAVFSSTRRHPTMNGAASSGSLPWMSRRRLLSCSTYNDLRCASARSRSTRRSKSAAAKAKTASPA